MSMRFEFAVQGRLDEYMESQAALAKGGMMAAAAHAGKEVVQRLRKDMMSVGFGARLANTWKANVYPLRGESLAPSAYIFSKAPRIVSAFAGGAVIRAVKGGVFLWIPTENVPRIGRGSRRSTPQDVENRFGMDFDIVPSLTRPGVYFAVLPLTKAKSGKGFRRNTQRRQATGRQTEMVVMFVLVRQVRLKKRLDVDGIAAVAAREWPEIVARSLAKAFLDDTGT